MMRQRKIGRSPGWRKKRFNRWAGPGRMGLLLLLALLLALGPVWSAAAGTEMMYRPERPLGLLATMGTVFGAAGDFVRGDQAGGRPIPEEDLSAIQASLEKFSLTVIRDPRLAEIIDAIIMEIATAEELPGGIQDNKEFIAEIIRDPRLIQVVGEVIGRYLQEEELADEIRAIAGVISDLITYPELHYFVRDCLAALLENKALGQMMNDLLLTATGMIYDAGSATVGDILKDRRIPGLAKEVTSLVTGTIPEILQFVEDNNDKILGLAEDILLIFTEYGVGLPPDLLEDARLKGCLAEITARMLKPEVLNAAVSMGFGLSEHLLRVGFVSTTEQLRLKKAAIGELVGGLVKEFFTAENAKAQKYFQESLTEVLERGRERAASATPKDLTVFGMVDADIQKKIADAVALVPPQMARLAAFTWLVEGTTLPGDPTYADTGVDPRPRSYDAWVKDVVGFSMDLLADNAGGLAAALNRDLERIVRDFLDDHGADISAVLREVILDLPLDRAAGEYRADEAALKGLAAELVERIFACLPLEELLQAVLDEDGISEFVAVVDEISAELFDELPFGEAAALIRDDRSILQALVKALPHIAPGELAAMIRHDDRIIAALGEATAGMPVETIIAFIQDEKRAALIGQNIAAMLLGVAADFVEDERMTPFSYEVVMGAIDSLEGTPAALIFDSLAQFLENENFTGYLIGSFHELAYGVNTELRHLYQRVVPRFFTQALWKFI